MTHAVAKPRISAADLVVNGTLGLVLLLCIGCLAGALTYFA